MISGDLEPRPRQFHSNFQLADRRALGTFAVQGISKSFTIRECKKRGREPLFGLSAADAIMVPSGMAGVRNIAVSKTRAIPFKADGFIHS